MRDCGPRPMLKRYAVLAFTACTSRNWSESAPGTRPVVHVVPPSVVRTHVPREPLTHTTRSLTGLTAISSEVVPLNWSVRTTDGVDCANADADAIAVSVEANSVR